MKTIAIVSNRPPINDRSKEIDACDLVIRVSKCDHYDTGLVGSRVDSIVLEPNMLWYTFSPEKKHTNLLARVPVYIRPFWDTFWKDKIHKRLLDINKMCPDLHVIDDPKIAHACNSFSTQALAVAWAAINYPEAHLWLYGLQTDESYHKHIRNTKWDNGLEWQYQNELMMQGRVSHFPM